jgi:hypothetical protein
MQLQDDQLMKFIYPNAAYIVVGETKHTGKYSSGIRLATGIREWLHRWGYPWNERDGIICVDALTHS